MSCLKSLPYFLEASASFLKTSMSLPSEIKPFDGVFSSKFPSHSYLSLCFDYCYFWFIIVISIQKVVILVEPLYPVLPSLPYPSPYKQSSTDENSYPILPLVFVTGRLLETCFLSFCFSLSPLPSLGSTSCSIFVDGPDYENDTNLP